MPEGPGPWTAPATGAEAQQNPKVLLGALPPLVPGTAGTTAASAAVTSRSAATVVPPAAPRILGELGTLLGSEQLEEGQPEIDPLFTDGASQTVELAMDGGEGARVGLPGGHLRSRSFPQRTHLLMNRRQLFSHLSAQSPNLGLLCFVQVQTLCHALPAGAAISALGSRAPVAATRSWSSVARAGAVAIFTPLCTWSSTPTALASSFSKLPELGALLRGEHTEEGGAEF